MNFTAKHFLAIILCVSLGYIANAQVSDTAKYNHIYHPEIDAKSEIAEAVKKAKMENKHVVLMVGGNWCRWCIMFQKFIDKDASIDSLVKKDFVFEHLNYSKENKNLAILKEFDFPQRFGFPVFVILDENGKRIHTQNSGLLEQGEGYSHDKVFEFFSQWRPGALDPKEYEEK